MACKKHEKNHLSEEKSPYLKQHEQNPIWWYAWSEDAFEISKKKNRLIFLSVGYSTCHWCHVMEKESFEKQDVADALNKDFVSIKVDREERPDVDSIYMDAVQAMTGSGGWPMTVIMTPDRKPIFGGTYIPKDRLLGLLGEVQKVWSSDPSKITETGEKVLAHLKAMPIEAGGGQWNDKIFEKLYHQELDNFDWENGSHKGQPKFPPGYSLRLLMRIHRRSGNKKALQMVIKTLDEMAAGGVYDHLMGGFHRYSVDDHWLVPHFEKMLYDQASMSRAYLEAYQVTKNPEYKLVVEEILDYVLREMFHGPGGFYSAQDADSDGEEGKFAVWSEDELKKELSKEEFVEIKRAYGVSPGGNFEGHSILFLEPGELRGQRSTLIRSAFEKMRKIRIKRAQPLKDTKIITAWNGLMIGAMAKAGAIFNKKEYIEASTRAGQFLLDKVSKDGALLRRWIDGEAKQEGFLQDYAFLIDGFIDLYQATFDESWIAQAERLQALQDQLFWDKNKSGYFDTSGKDNSLIFRSKKYFDNVKPSGNSMALLNLVRLRDLTFKENYKGKADALLKSFPKIVGQAPAAFPQFLMALDYELDRSKEVAVVGTNGAMGVPTAIDRFDAEFLPNLVISYGKEGQSSLPLLKGKSSLKGKTTVYVCEKGVCRIPTFDFSEALNLIGKLNQYEIK